MKYNLPLTIDNGVGERITFREIVVEPGGDKLIIDGFCKSGSGPAMHVHYRQDEGMTVKRGRLGYEILGEEQKFINVGESVSFKRGVPHRFWNAGEDDLHMESWVKPMNSIIFFLSALYDSQRRSGSHRPNPFDGAYLLTRYKNEYSMPGLPAFVKKVIFPVTYCTGRLLGKYKKYRNSPEPL
jgi:mannose-6-phosphate isomerase-like protein (cupin superfamily)